MSKPIASSASISPAASSPGSAARIQGLTARDAERVAAAFEADLAASTRKGYASAWRQWETWARARAVSALPADPEALAAFLTERAETGLTFGSIEMACSAIAYRHHQHGLFDPTAHVTVRRVRRGLRRILGTAPRHQAHPLSVAELATLVTSIDADRDSVTAKGRRDRAILLIGYAAALRASELAALRIEDLETRPNGVLIHIRRSKTDQDGHGQLVGVASGQHHDTDPLAALTAWLAIRPRHTDELAGPATNWGSGPLFTRIDHAGEATAEAICMRTVARMVTARAHAAGMEDLGISSHSLRAGHATTAALNGLAIDRIAAQTRHRDIRHLVDRYIRPVDALLHTTSRDLGL